MKGFYSVAEFAHKLGMSYSAVYRWVIQGRIGSMQLSHRGKLWIPESELALLQGRDWLTLHELARALGVSYLTALTWKKEGRFEYLQPRENGAIRVHRSELERLQRARPEDT